jgi:NAD(P)-dependent dehydrogenase (short-subunit alcohol dehydrogenase family)
MDVTNLSGKVALVTGAGSGIGKATALAFARRGANLVLCDVNAPGLTETAGLIRGLGREVVSRTVDVADRDQMRAFADAVYAEIPAVDILMNNAGVGLAATFLDTEMEDWDWIVGINLLGVVHGCHFFVPKMVERGRGGHVINVSSAAGYSANHVLCAYSATKFAVLGFSEALRDELEPHHIGVTAVCPGIINTAITQTSRMKGQAATPEARQAAVEFYRRRNYGPERVAENILKAVQRNRAVAPISPEAWAFYYLKRWAPGIMVRVRRAMSARMMRQAGQGEVR